MGAGARACRGGDGAKGGSPDEGSSGELSSAILVRLARCGMRLPLAPGDATATGGPPPKPCLLAISESSPACAPPCHRSEPRQSGAKAACGHEFKAPTSFDIDLSPRLCTTTHNIWSIYISSAAGRLQGYAAVHIARSFSTLEKSPYLPEFRNILQAAVHLSTAPAPRTGEPQSASGSWDGGPTWHCITDLPHC